MTKQNALKLKAQAEQDKRIKGRVIGAGKGYRVQLILRNGTHKLEINRFEDLPTILYLWEDL